ncbi:radical SAM protein [Candidatus Pacearchaeota archaeon]|nr:radical SAM protein [Candidatus Pacearchaeota archaeon]
MISKHQGKLPRGCELCSKGEKLVLFITGICPRNCLYCPLSEKKKNKDVVYANEVKLSEMKQLLNEVRSSGAKGAGITGGDPLSKINRTIFFIKELKKNFGKDFHIHLYTSLNLIDEKIVKLLQDSRLDELRIHPDLERKDLWEKAKLVKGKFSEVGVEIPIFPGKEKEIIEMINFFKTYVDFFNLNELEYATLYEKEYSLKKWKTLENYEVSGSEKTALKIINHFKKQKLRIHYCSAEFKDKIQFTERIKLRAKNSAEKFDLITKDGTLLRGAIYLEESKPTFESERKKFSEKEKQKLHLLFSKLSNSFPKLDFKIDYQKFRILCNAEKINDISKSFKNCAIVEEYPTQDHLEVFMEFLS